MLRCSTFNALFFCNPQFFSLYKALELLFNLPTFTTSTMAAAHDGFVKFPKITAFKNVCYYHVDVENAPKVTYGAKIKLHGTNAGIRVSVHGNVTAQKRTTDITSEDDNAGFAAWVDACKEPWKDAVRKNESVSEMTVIVYGEWIGPGVMGGPEATSKIPKKSFFVFGVQAGNSYITCPIRIAEFVPTQDDVFVIPWFFSPEKLEMSIDFDKPETLTAISEIINVAVDEIGVEDPYIKDAFGISGPGEGLVLTPYRIDGDAVSGEISLRRTSDFIFKAKTEKHRAKKSKVPATPVAEIPESVKEFVTEFVTEVRCRQAVTEACDGTLDKTKIPAFAKWIGTDVKEESTTELEKMGVPWKLVSKAVNKAAISWFVKECTKKLEVGHREILTRRALLGVGERHNSSTLF